MLINVLEVFCIEHMHLLLAIMQFSYMAHPLKHFWPRPWHGRSKNVSV